MNGPKLLQRVIEYSRLSVCFACCGAVWAQSADPLSLPLENWPVATKSPKAQVERVSQGRGQSTAANPELPSADSSTLSFIAVTPCRLLDTRAGQGFSGAYGPPGLTAGQPRTIVVPQSSCRVPAAAAYSLNFAVVPPAGGVVGYLSAWAVGQPMPSTAVLNGTQGGVVNEPAIVTANVNGAFVVQASDNTDLVIDLNGYFIAQPFTQFRGTWSSVVSYAPGDVVNSSSGGVISSYVALSTTQGVNPVTDVLTNGGHWAVFAQGAQGLPGPQGSDGSQGPAGASA